MFAYPLPSIPTHFQPILIEHLTNPIGINTKSVYLFCFENISALLCSIQESKNIVKIKQLYVFGLIPIGFVRFSIRMGWEWVGIDGKGHANTTYISEFYPRNLAGRIFQKKGLSGGGGRLSAAAGSTFFFLFIQPARMWG